MLEELASEQGQKQENGEILTPLKMLFCSHADMVAWNVIKGVGDDYRVFMELRKQLADRPLRPEKDGKNTFESKVEKRIGTVLKRSFRKPGRPRKNSWFGNISIRAISAWPTPLRLRQDPVCIALAI